MRNLCVIFFILLGCSSKEKPKGEFKTVEPQYNHVVIEINRDSVLLKEIDCDGTCVKWYKNHWRYANIGDTVECYVPK